MFKNHRNYVASTVVPNRESIQSMCHKKAGIYEEHVRRKAHVNQNINHTI